MFLFNQHFHTLHRNGVHCSNMMISGTFWDSKATLFTNKASYFQMYLFNVGICKLPFCESACLHSPQKYLHILMILCTALTCWLNASFSSEWEQTWFFMFSCTFLIWWFRVPFLRQQSHTLHSQGFLFSNVLLQCASSSYPSVNQYVHYPLSTDMIPNPSDFMHCFSMLIQCALLNGCLSLSTDMVLYVLVHCSNMII